MNAYYFTFRSVTLAQRALRTLTEAGIPAQLSRTPSAIAKNGCGYCLRVARRWADAAARALADAGVQRVWLRQGDRYEELERDLL